MKNFRLPIGSLAAVIFSVSAAASQGIPNFAPGKYLCASDNPILGNNGFSAPAVADWNQDGKKDLLVGVYYYGNILLYLNQGTDEEPVFAEGVYLEADGVPIQVGYG